MLLKKIKVVFIYSLVIVSFNIKANIFTDLVDILSGFFTHGFSKTVNTSVEPLKADCQSSPTAPVIVSSSIVTDPQPVISEEKTEETPREKLLNNFKKLNGDPIALKQALCFYDKNIDQKFKAQGDPSRPNGIKIQNQRYITINDLNKSYFDSRMFILDMETGEVKSYFSAHGSGGKKGVAESDAFVNEVSNSDGSNATPRGFFVTGVRVEGASDPRWKFSMKLHGLQSGVNDKSYSRAVIMHSFPDVNNNVASSNDERPNLHEDPRPFYLSKGCTMLGPDVASNVINTLKSKSNKEGGSLYYNYSSVEKKRGENYCGDENLLKI